MVIVVSLCACVLCALVWTCARWEAYIYFSLITCYRWPCLIALLVVWCELSTTNQASVLNYRLPKYGIYFMYTALEHVILATGGTYDWAHDWWEPIYYFTASMHFVLPYCIPACHTISQHSCISHCYTSFLHFIFLYALVESFAIMWLLVVLARVLGPFLAVDELGLPIEFSSYDYALEPNEEEEDQMMKRRLRLCARSDGS